jgi:hypothetical protein
MDMAQYVLDGGSSRRRCTFLQIFVHFGFVHARYDALCKIGSLLVYALLTRRHEQNFLLGTAFQNGGIAILLSALTALYQMTFAGFFVHLSSIPAVLRWLQWLCPLKYTLEALSVNEVGSGLMIQDTLQGVPVSVSASLIMTLVSVSISIVNFFVVDGCCSCLDSIRITTTGMFLCCLGISPGSVLVWLVWFGLKYGNTDDDYGIDHM